MSDLQSPRPYAVPPVFRDLVLLDMMELGGSTVAAAKLLNLSQPTVSRRFRSVCKDLQLQGDLRQPPGIRIQPTPCLRLLRKGICHHRWDANVLRLGHSANAMPRVSREVGVEWIALEPQGSPQWSSLLRAELLDGIVTNTEALLGVQSSWRVDDLGQHGEEALVLISRRHPKVSALVSALLSS